LDLARREAAMRGDMSRDGRLQPRKAELERSLVRDTLRQFDMGTRRVAARGEIVDHGPTRVTKADELCKLVERFTCSVIACRAELSYRLLCRSLNAIKSGVSA